MANRAAAVEDELRGVHILFVDDDADARAIFKRLMEYCGAFVLVAASAKEGIALFNHVRPTMLITDLNMPDGDGYELLTAVRKLEAADGRTIPALMVTGMPLEEHRQRALSAGFAEVLGKPVDLDTLRAVIARLAGGR